MPYTRAHVSVRYAGFLAIGLATVAISGCGASQRKSSARSPGPRIASIRSQFPLLHDGHSVRPPTGVIRGLGTTKTYGLVLQDAVKVKLVGGPSLWMVPGTRDTCIAWVDQPEAIYQNTTYDATCATDASILQVGTFMVIASSRRETVVGVEPSDAAKLTAVTGGGAAVTTALHEGVYTFVAKRPSFIAAIHAPGGALPIPRPDQWQ